MTGLLYGCRDGMNTIAVAIGIPLMNVVAVGLRFYARRRQEVRLGADDWWALAGLILLLGLAADLLVAAVNQVLSCPQPSDAILMLAKAGPLAPRVAWAFYLIGTVAVGVVKLSFLWCMRRVFCTGEKGTLFSKVTFTVMGIVYLWTFGFVIAMVLINVNWGAPNQGDPRDWGNAPATYSTDTMFYAMTVSDVLIDAMIMILPLLVVWRLNLSLGRKFSISGIFLLRLLALAASITRMSYTIMFAKWMTSLLDIDPRLADPNHLLVGQNLNTQMIWWTMLEVGFGLFASCITTIQFLLRRHHVEHFVDKIRGLLGLSVKDRRRPSETQVISEPKSPFHGRTASKRGALYAGDDCSVLSAEYMIGSIRPSPSVELHKLATKGATVETRQIYARKDSDATMSILTEDHSEMETNSTAGLTHVGLAV